MRKETIASQKNRFLKFATQISRANGRFKQINQRWRGAITAGKIEAGRMEKEAAALFGPLVQDMNATISRYEKIQARLTDAVLIKMAGKVINEIRDAAGFTINILKRNLFERTADVGYLATDAEIINFLNVAAADTPDDSLENQRQALKHRLAEYRYEYTVYDEIIILDLAGNVLANLDDNNVVTHSQDPLLSKTQGIDLHDGSGRDPYVETFRGTDLMPGRGDVLIYSQKIEDPLTQTPLGTLCLCFDFEDEMTGIFSDLQQGNNAIISAVLDHKGRVISSSNTAILPLSSTVSVSPASEFDIITCDGKEFLACSASTDGYQGFYGLTWYGFAMIDASLAFSEDKNQALVDQESISRIQNFSQDLSLIKKESDDLLANMKIDGLNGIIQAAKFRDKTFVEILHFVEEIGVQIDTLFSSAISSLQQTVVASLFTDVGFRAFQGNNIADRNLYERANDVCWWALTPKFRSILARRANGSFEKKDAAALKENLEYINNLYTPYLRLILTDATGEVIAVSNPPAELEEQFTRQELPKGQEFVGMKIDGNIVRQAISLPSSQDYCVTEFSSTPLYGGRPTYIYATAVRDPEKIIRPVGAILIVFDAEPQFQAMLTDILPKDENKQIIEQSFAVFSDRTKTVIATTSRDYPVGSTIPIGDAFFSMKNGERKSAVVTLDSHSYAMGIQVSEGYREYKRQDGYINDIICMVFIPV